MPHKRGIEWFVLLIETRRSQNLILRASFAILISLNSSVWGAEWTLQSDVSVREIYTDNVTLAPDNERWELVTEVTPGVFLNGKGPRFELDFLFDLQATVYPSGNFDDEINPELQAAGTGALIEELLFVQVNSTITQNNADNTGRIASDNISQTGNRINTYTYSVSPFLRNRFGSFAESELRYVFDEVINEGDTLDSKAHGGRFQIDGGTRFARLPWQLFAEGQAVEFDDGTTTSSGMAGSNVRYLINSKFSIFGGGGYEFNDFGSPEDDDGLFWQVGSAWRPSSHTTVEGGFGRRFFGGNFFFTAEHESRRTVWRASFREEPTQTRDVDLQIQLVPLTDPFGDPVSDPLSRASRSQIRTDEANPTSEVFVSQRFDGSVAFRGRRTNVELTGFHEKRDFQITGDEETVFGASLAASRRLGRRLAVQMAGRWQVFDLRDGIQEDTRWEGSIGVTYTVARSIDSSIEYRYLTQESTNPEVEFDENRITASLTARF